MKFVLSTLVLVCSVSAFGQAFQNNAVKRYEAEGRVLTFRVVPGEKSAKLFLLGRKAGELNLNADARLISVTALHGGRSERLLFKPDGEAYLIPEFPENGDLMLTLKAEVHGRKDQVKIRMKKP